MPISLSRKPLIGLTGRIERQGPSLLSLRQAYSNAVFEAGGMPVVLPVIEGEDFQEWIACLDGLILTGGEDINPLNYVSPPHPRLGRCDMARDKFEIGLVKAWLETGKPLLGICRGIQTLQVAIGGKLIQDIPSEIPSAWKHSQSAPREEPLHEVFIEEDSLLARLLETSGLLRVNSFHHQSVTEPVEGFRISARAGDGIIEGIEAADGRTVLGVQWHPEEMNDPAQKKMFLNFVAHARINAVYA